MLSSLYWVRVRNAPSLSHNVTLCCLPFWCFRIEIEYISYDCCVEGRIVYFFNYIIRKDNVKVQLWNSRVNLYSLEQTHTYKQHFFPNHLPKDVKLSTALIKKNTKVLRIYSVIFGWTLFAIGDSELKRTGVSFSNFCKFWF